MTLNNLDLSLRGNHQRPKTIKTPEQKLVNDDVLAPPPGWEENTPPPELDLKEAELYEKGEPEVSPQPSFEESPVVDVAYKLLQKGFMPIPVWLDEQSKKLIPKGIRWDKEPYIHSETIQETWDKIKDDFRKAEGVAIKCGEVSKLIVIDVDDPEKFDEFYPIDKLRREAGYVVRSRTPGRYHFGFAYEEEFDHCLKLVEKAGFELKSNGGTINIFSTIPGQTYTVEKFECLRPMPGELKQRIRDLLASKRTRSASQTKPSFERRPDNPEELAEKILTILEPYYNRGTRHHFALATAGIFRIAGIPEEIATDTLLGFYRDRGDDEIQDRERTIRDTYQKSREEPITKFGYLKDALSVSDERIEQIKKLIRKDDAKRQEQTEERIPVAKKVLALLEQQNFSFWHSQFDEAFVTISPTQHLKLESKDFKDYLQSLLYETDGRTLHNQALEEVISICRQWARKSNTRHHVHLRTGFDAERNFVEVNLGRPDGKVLHITENGYAITDPELKFLRPKNLLPISFNPAVMVDKDAYTKEIVLELFSKLFHLQSEEDFALLLAWMLKTFYPVGEYPILAILGEKEAVGKTTISKFIANLLDPTPSPLKTFPRNRDDLYSLAKNNFLLVFDNLSNISPDMSDALCQLSTGGSLSKRKLYTDGDAVDYPLKNPIVLNSIFNILHRRDLRRRCVVIELKRPNQNKSQKELDQIFREYAPHCYAYLVQCVQEALKNKVIDAPLLDLADFCEWVAKAHPVFFLDGKTFVETLNTNREQTAIEILETNIVASFIADKVKEGIWITTPGKLSQQIREQYPHEKDIPLTPEKMAREIRKIASDLEAVGIKVDTTQRSKSGRIVVFRKIEKKEEAQPKKDAPATKSQAVEKLKELLSKRTDGDCPWDVDPETREELIAKGLSVGKRGVYICETKEIAEIKKHYTSITSSYTVYALDQILEAFPELMIENVRA